MKDDYTMIDYKLLLHDIKDTKEEFEKLISISSKKHISVLKDVEFIEPMTIPVDIHILMNTVHILDELIRIIESGEFDVSEKYQ